MKLYDSPAAANCQRVTLYLAEKGLEIVRITVDILKLENKTPEFLRKNPSGKIPLLETDDGTFIAESAAIVEYLEELFPQPPMIGATALARAHVRRLERIASESFVLLSTCVVHTHPYFKTRPGRPVDQYPAVAAESRERLLPLLELLNVELASHPFLGSDRPTVADCTLFAALRFGLRFGFPIPHELPRITEWYQRFSTRPSVLKAMGQ